MGALRITYAEFVKIFKKPSVYIMGTILAVILVVTSFFFSPEKSSNSQLNINAASVDEALSIYESGSESEKNSKIYFDADVESASFLIDFYKGISDYKVSVENAYNNLITSYATLAADTYASYKTALQTFQSLLQRSPSAYISFNQNYWTSSATLAKITSNVSVISGATSSPVDQFKTMYNTNSYGEMLKAAKDTAINQISYYNQELLSALQKDRDVYVAIVSGTGSPEQNGQYETYRNKCSIDLQNLKLFLDLVINNSDLPLLLVSDSEYKNVIGEIETLIAKLDEAKGGTLLNNIDQATALNNSSVIENATKLLSADHIVMIDDETLEDLQAVVSITQERLSALDEKIMSATQGTSLNELKEDIAGYKDMATRAYNIAYNTIYLNMLNNLEDQQILALHGYDFEHYNRYISNESLIKDNYIFDHNSYSFDYSDVFRFNQSSTTQTNYFDFMFYGLRISTLFIIVFTIIMAASLIASEFDSGTIKLLAIRPYKRHKILTGKFLATMFFVITFVCFSALITFIIGIARFSFSTLPVLAVFNSSVAFKISPSLLMILNILSIIIEIMFFAIIALAFSCITRSYAATITCTSIIYLLSLGLNILLGGYLWYAYTPFVNIDLFKFLGGGTTTSSNFLATMFTTPLLINMNFFISLAIYAGIVILLVAITHVVFSKRDL